MNRAYKFIYATERKRHERSELNLHEQNIHASSPAGAGQAIRPLKNNFVRMKNMNKFYHFFISHLFVVALLLIVFSGCEDKNKLITNHDFGTVTDVEGNVYKTITIGDLTWMAEDLFTTTYRNGDTIFNAIDDSSWSVTSFGAYCNYNYASDSALFSSDYNGRLYNWFAINDKRKIAPLGWHVATDDDWKNLEKNLGMDTTIAKLFGPRGSSEGDKIKGSGWSSDDNATNESGFSAYPGGYRSIDGTYYDRGNMEGFWTVTSEKGSLSAIERRLYSGSQIYRTYSYKRTGYAVRCVKDTIE